MLDLIFDIFASIELVYPKSLDDFLDKPAEWLAWLSAVITTFLGLGFLLFPKSMMRLTGLAIVEGSRDGVSEVRSAVGGMLTGLGLAVLVLHPQPLMYMALGTALFFVVLGRIISLVFNGAISPFIVVATLVEGAMAFFSFAYVLDLF